MTNYLSPNGTFYNEIWQQKLDDKFLEELQWEAELHRRPLTCNDHQILSGICDKMNKVSKHPLSYLDIYTRFQLAQLRYITWNWLMNCKDVQYNPNKFSIETTPDTWERICKLHEIGCAYQSDPTEIMWYELNSIFGPDSARDPDITSYLPKKLKREMRNINNRGVPLPTIDELLEDYEKEKREYNKRKSKRKKIAATPTQTSLPPDMMSSTKGPSHIILLSLNHSNSVQHATHCVDARSESTGSTPSARRFLDF